MSQAPNKIENSKAINEALDNTQTINQTVSIKNSLSGTEYNFSAAFDQTLNNTIDIMNQLKGFEK